ncbi:alpha-mannosidase [Naematelia encephala]|uniref:Alpha-mannosidase n=1 Tax=Naematelia encephala TaxID=71784 RepID=A0A1Y2BCS3_9TREE|nr:alpha-mannosidase [Naematelia encephala]
MLNRLWSSRSQSEISQGKNRDNERREEYPQRNLSARTSDQYISPKHGVSYFVLILSEPKEYREQTLKRLDNFVGGYYAPYNLSAVLEYDRVSGSGYVELEVWSPPEDLAATFSDAKEAFELGKGVGTRKGHNFGPTWTNHWFKVTLRVPDKWPKDGLILFEWDSSGEAMIFDSSGLSLQGFTGSNDLDLRRAEYVVPSADVHGGTIVRYIEMSCNNMVGIEGIDPPPVNKYYQLKVADLVLANQEARRLALDFEALHSLAETLPPQSPLGNTARTTANQIMTAFSVTDDTSIGTCRKLAEGILGENWEEALTKERRQTGRDQSGKLWAFGHCHIDTAWLWPWEVTKKKIARSWSSQLDLMERYPEHRFVATSAQQYAWLEEYYPAVFDRLKTKVNEGKFELVGATWLEHDANMLSGESFCRQFLLGQNFFESRFGKRCETFMLPDTFGYSASLPQIARLSDCRNFFTQKISWNAYNAFPHTTFNWIGMDGSQILTHMTPVVNYNSTCHFPDIIKGYTGHHNLDVCTDAMILFGNGDGGGGPTPEMLERLRRARAVGVENDPKGMEIPLVREGWTMSDFFETVREKTDNGDRLPSWWGELYLEIHRGTYTSQAAIKKGNRKGEVLLRTVEHAATLASLTSASYTYPQALLTRCWQALCLCQFHDTLPGSSIQIAVKDAQGKYVELQEMGSRLLDEALSVLYRQPKEDSGGKRQVLLNSLPGLERQEVLAVRSLHQPRPGEKHPDGPGEIQWSKRDGTLWFAVAGCEAGSHAGALDFRKNDESGVKVSVKHGVATLENEHLQVDIVDGRLTRIWDVKAKRDVIPKGTSAGFVIYEDHPNDWDAWDVDASHLEKPELLKFSSVEIAEEGPVRAILSSRLTFGQSSARVNITMDAVSASTRANSRSLLRFDVDIDWREKHRFLKFELPTTVQSTEATYDAAFGVVTRPTHRNTSWEAAKFEVCAHKFADLSEYGYGVALVNESKYGYAVQGNIMRLSLLRAPLRPDPTCDQGRQEFAFAIYPHLGTYVESDVQVVAHAFNSPLEVRLMDEMTDPSPHALELPFTVEGARNVMLETVKRAEKDFTYTGKIDTEKSKGKSKNVILRLFEHLGGRGIATLKLHGIKVKRVMLVNILEDEIAPLQVQDGRVELEFTAFEIKTVKVTLA